MLLPYYLLQLPTQQLWLQLYATKDLGVRLGAVEFKFVSEEDNARLIATFSEDEVKEAVWQCEGSKCIRLDGFNFNFIKNCW